MNRANAHPMEAALRQRGAALLMAMLTVALVSTLATAALWQQWRRVEIEASERSRLQASWILGGALDWARLILREDARTGGPDHLGEPWSVALNESRLSTFLAMDRSNADDTDEVFLSGQIVDAQARMNVFNLVASGKVSEPDLEAFRRLFELLGLDPAEIERVAENLRLALDAATEGGAVDAAALRPRRVEQLRWLGLSSTSLQVLAPHITLLPGRTTLNLNTAGAEAIAASVPGFDLAGARRLVGERERAPFRTLAEAARLLPAAPAPAPQGAPAPRAAASAPRAATPAASDRLSVTTRFFEVRGRLRIDNLVVEERSLVLRNGLDVVILWRERAALDPTRLAQAPR
jgi:general secretion pathway protein K